MNTFYQKKALSVLFWQVEDQAVAGLLGLTEFERNGGAIDKLLLKHLPLLEQFNVLSSGQPTGMAVGLQRVYTP